MGFFGKISCHCCQ